MACRKASSGETIRWFVRLSDVDTSTGLDLGFAGMLEVPYVDVELATSTTCKDARLLLLMTLPFL